jgi:hypothetical protein
LCFRCYNLFSCCLSKPLFHKWKEGTFCVTQGPLPGWLSFQISQGLGQSGRGGGWAEAGESIARRKSKCD